MMKVFDRAVWIPTAVFVALTAAVAVFMLRQGSDALYAIIAAALVTPPVWSAIARPTRGGGVGRGASAGALIEALTQLLPCVRLLVLKAIRGGYNGADVQDYELLAVLLSGLLACLAAVPGSVCGALLAYGSKARLAKAAEDKLSP